MTGQDPKQTIEAARALLRVPSDAEGLRRDMTALIDRLETWVDESGGCSQPPAPFSRLASIGLLASGIAHDFNNLLTVIQMSAELLEALPEGSEQRSNMIRDIQTAAERGGALTTQVLNFAQRKPSTLQEVEVGGLIEELAPILDRLLGDDITLRHERTGEPLWLGTGPGQLEQVIINLVINARDAMGAGGTIRLVTASTTPHEVLLQVTDTGHGMDTEVVAQIFDPFFTTKATADGTGLGLANVKDIITRLGGRITVDSTPGAGTTFSITLPRSTSPAAPEP